MRGSFNERVGGMYTNHCDKLCKVQWPYLQCSAVPEKLWWDTQTKYIIPQTNLFLYKESKLNSMVTPALFAAREFRNFSTISGRFSLLLPPFQHDFLQSSNFVIRILNNRLPNSQRTHNCTLQRQVD
jgi:hypothetical protein